MVAASRPVAGLAHIQHIEQAEFEHEVLLVGSGGSGLGFVDVGEEDSGFGHELKFRTLRTVTVASALLSHETFQEGQQ